MLLASLLVTLLSVLQFQLLLPYCVQLSLYGLPKERNCLRHHLLNDFDEHISDIVYVKHDVLSLQCACYLIKRINR